MVWVWGASGRISQCVWLMLDLDYDRRREQSCNGSIEASNTLPHLSSVDARVGASDPSVT